MGQVTVLSRLCRASRAAPRRCNLADLHLAAQLTGRERGGRGGELEPAFAEAVLTEDGAAASSSAAPAIILSMFASASPAQVAAVLKALQ